MSQTGFTPISLYYSATATNTPTAGNLVAGELAINTADGKLFYKDSAGVVQVIGTKGGVGSSTTTQVLYNSSGLVVGSANMTFNGTALTLANDASISGLTVGLGAGSTSASTVLGVGALSGSNTGNYNTAIGKSSLLVNTSGSENVSIGFESLKANTTGLKNVSVGTDTMASNTTGGSNVALGWQALVLNTTASNNTAVGYQAGYSNTTGSYMTAVGYQAGYNNTTANNGTYIGFYAGRTASGASNTCVGYFAGTSLTTGYSNTFIGGLDSSASYASGALITTGNNNTIIGNFNGNQGGLDIRTASNYIVLSDGAGNPRGIFDNSGKFLINTTAQAGSRVTVFNNNAEDTIAISTGSSYWGINQWCQNAGTQYFQVFRYGTVASAVGVGSITGNNTAVIYGTISDYRLKENVAPMTGALATVSALKPVTYKWKIDGSNGQGFIAHELQAVVPDCVSGEKDAVNEDGSIKAQSVDTSFLVATLTAAIQELKAEFDAYKATHP